MRWRVPSFDWLFILRFRRAFNRSHGALFPESP
jgi:hypothetical protein